MDFEEELLSPLPSIASGSPSGADSGSGSESPTPTSRASSPVVPLNLNARMTAPKLGGTYDKDVVWIGGPPKKDFSGPFLSGPPTPLCLRNMDASSEIKGYARRTLGHDIKFKRDDPDFGLMAFADVALQHMQTCGMDTVFYMQGVDDNGEAGRELFTYHTRYTKSTVDKFIADQIAAGKFDKLQKDALAQSATWLSNSLDESLKSSLRTQLASRPTGPQLWMLIVAEVQSDSLNRCDNMAEKFRTMTLSQFKGENVRDYVKEAGDLLTQLERDEQLPRTHLKRIVDVFSACSVADFRVHWMSRRAAVQKFIKDSAGKDEETKLQMPNYIHFNHLLDEGKDEFMNLQEQWGPAKNTGPSTQAMLSKLTAQVASLDQQLKAKTGDTSPTPNGEKKGIKCFGCGKQGYTKKTCPDCKAKREAANGNSNSSGDKQTSPSGSGKWAAPKDGEPTEKMIDGALHKWCAKCRRGKGRWTKDHSTAEHKVGFFKDKKEKTDGEAAKLAQGPFSQELFTAWSE